jgi:molybdopterin biosynthesis enzyme MoaB
MAPPPVFVSPTDEELATLGLVCAPVGASAEDVAMMSRAALGVCARTGLIVCLAGEPRLAAECSSQTIGQGVKGSKISN